MSIGGYDYLHPHVRMKILSGPKSVTEKQLYERLLHFEYRNEPKKKPKVEMHFDNSDGLAMNLAVLILGLKVRVVWGYDDLLSKQYDVTLRKIKGTGVRSPETKSPMADAMGIVKMECDVAPAGVALLIDGNNKVWKKGGKISTIARRVAKQMGITAAKKIFIEKPGDVPAAPIKFTDPVQRYFEVYDDEDMWSALNRLAVTAGLDFYIEGDEFHFHSSGYLGGAAANVLSYFKGPDLLRWDIEGNYAINLQGVKALSHDRDKAATYTYDQVASKMGVALTGKAAEVLNRAPLKPKDVIRAVKASARAHAGGRYMRQIRDRWKLKFELVGDPRVMRGTKLMLDNFGPIIDSQDSKTAWNVHGMRHVIDTSGYTMYLTLRGVRTTAARGSHVVYTFDPVTGDHGVAVVATKNFGKGKKGSSEKYNQRKHGGISSRYRSPVGKTKQSWSE
jgi:hypothetical protein